MVSSKITWADKKVLSYHEQNPIKLLTEKQYYFSRATSIKEIKK